MTNPTDVTEALLKALTGSAVAKALRESNPALAERAVTAFGDVKWGNIDVGIEHAGTKITLPADPNHMSIDEGIDALQRKKKDLDTKLDVHEIIDAFPLDGAVAFVKALERKYGWATSAPVPGFWGPKPPQMITVDVGPGPKEKIQVPWGGFVLPGVDGQINTSVTNTPRGSALVIYGTVKKKDVTTLKDIADMTREIVRTESIYRGRAIRLRSASAAAVDISNPPEFMDLSAA